MRELHLLATKYQTRPSSFVGLTGLRALLWDRAVEYAGTANAERETLNAKREPPKPKPFGVMLQSYGG